jgi:hypothetical protein
VAIINFVKYKKYKNPVYSAAKSISLTSACVSIITLEATMLTAFGSDMDIFTRRLFLGFTGGAVSLFVIFMAINIIVNGFNDILIMKLKINKTKKINSLCLNNVYDNSNKLAISINNKH